VRFACEVDRLSAIKRGVRRHWRHVMRSHVTQWHIARVSPLLSDNGRIHYATCCCVHSPRSHWDRGTASALLLTNRRRWSHALRLLSYYIFYELVVVLSWQLLPHCIAESMVAGLFQSVLVLFCLETPPIFSTAFEVFLTISYGHYIFCFVSTPCSKKRSPVLFRCSFYKHWPIS